MAKTLQDYITESQNWVDQPSVGDDFAINIREECLVESHIVDVVEDGIVIEADEGMIEILESYGLLETADPYRREVSPTSPEEFEEGLTTGALIGAALGAKGAWHAGKKSVERNFNADEPSMLKAAGRTVKDLAQGMFDPRTYVPKKKKSDVEEGVAEGQSYAVDNLLSLMRKAMAGIDVSSGYSRQGKIDIKKIYEVLRYPLMRGSMSDFKDMWEHASATAPDAFDAFADELFAAAGLPEGSTYDEFMQSLNSMQEGWNDHIPDPDNYREYLDQLLTAADLRRKEQRAAVSEPAPETPKAAPKQDEDMCRLRELAGMPPMAMPAVNEGGMKRKIDDLYYDFKQTTDIAPDISDDDYLALAAEWLQKQGIDRDQVEDIGEMFIDMRDHEEDDDHDYANAVDAEQYDDEDMMEGAAPEIDYDSLEVDGIDTSDYPDFADAYFASGQYQDGTPIPDDVLDDLTRDGELLDRYITRQIYEAEYQGREVPLGKPMAGDVKKSKVYVKGPKGNVVKVNFGDKTMRIKKSNPGRRKNFRARHNCANPGPRWKARYWSCRAW